MGKNKQEKIGNNPIGRKKMKDLKIERKKIGPEQAEALLKLNTNNRPINWNYVSFLSREMLEGRWQEQKGETIQISENNILIDGQQRLHAIIKSGSEYYFNIAYNVINDGFKTTDQHRKRNASQVLAQYGVINSTAIASIITKYDSFISGRGIPNNINDSTGGAGLNSKIYTPDAIYEIYKTDMEFYDKCGRIAGNYNKSGSPSRLLSKQIIGASYAIISKKYKTFNIDKFFDKIFLGIDIVERSNEYFIRKELIEIKSNPLIKLSASVFISYMIHYVDIIVSGKSYTRNRFKI